MGCINSVPRKRATDFDGVITDAKPGNDAVADQRVAVMMREKRAASRRRDIFAERVEFDAPLELVAVPKSNESNELILQALSSNFLFHSIDASELETVVQFMADKTAAVNDVIIQQGGAGDFFYVVESGSYSISTDGTTLHVAQRGGTFGELALVYNCPRTATITCTQAGRLWMLDRVTFRRLVAKQQADQIGQCKAALRNVSLLKPLTDFQLGQLAEAAEIVVFAQGDRIIKKGEDGNVLYIIKSGSVVCTEAGETQGTEELRLNDGDYFGERALMTHEPRAANVTAATEVTLIALDRQAFDDLLGSLREVIDRNMSMRVLQSIPMLKYLSPYEKEKLFLALEPKSFIDGEFVIREGEQGTTFYIIKSGSATVKKTVENGEKKQIATLASGNFFGEMSLLRNEPRQADVIASGALECLSLDQAKFVELLGPVQDVLNREADERKQALSMAEKIPMADLEQLRTLGMGTFGRVKLVRHKTTGKPFALKILNKANIVAYKQQLNVINEKRIMEQCHHPFILKLYQTFKDAGSLYLLVEFVQGGELFTYLHCSPHSPGRLKNDHACFYASHVLMAIEYLHDRSILYRDLKPENLLIDPLGYLKMVDFGFAKVVPDRTYTLCGTPEYLAPELVLGKGHNKGVDYWALGVLLFEMLVGYSPFAGANQADQMQICRNIVKAPLEFPGWVSEPARDLITKLLIRDVTKRMGLTHGGAGAVRAHPWFAAINWDSMYNKKEPAPYRPKFADPFDASKFDTIAEDNDTPKVGGDDSCTWDADF